jgi:transcriptional regulator with XRE-family HTH domain
MLDGVTKADAQREGLIAQRLNKLWEAWRPEGREYSLREVARAVNTEAGRNVVSAQYLSDLRRGVKTDPSYSILAALAKFFQVSPDYFADDEETAGRTEAELRLLAALKDGGVRTLALCAEGLSEESLATITEIIRKIRAAEGLPPAEGE